MRRSMMWSMAVAVVLSSGCYRATIETGRPPSGQTVEKAWAHSFISGLVPPATVETASRCPNGVARVQTQLSFLNMLAGGVTFGLYSPMTIKVQCAAAGGGNDETSAVHVPENASLQEATDVFNKAVETSRSSGAAVLIRFE